MKKFNILCMAVIAFSLVNPGCKKAKEADKRPPVAKAGTDNVITLPTNNVMLRGNSSYDPDGYISHYSWTKIAGPSIYTIMGANDPETMVINLVNGIYLFELSVTDNSQLQDKDTVSITVSLPAANQLVVNNLAWQYNINDGLFHTTIQNINTALPANYTISRVTLDLYSTNRWEFPVIPVGSTGPWSYYYEIQNGNMEITSSEWSLNQYTLAVKIEY